MVPPAGYWKIYSVQFALRGARWRAYAWAPRGASLKAQVQFIDTTGYFDLRYRRVRELGVFAASRVCSASICTITIIMVRYDNPTPLSLPIIYNS
jgi:hypothetical protein